MSNKTSELEDLKILVETTIDTKNQQIKSLRKEILDKAIEVADYPSGYMRSELVVSITELAEILGEEEK